MGNKQLFDLMIFVTLGMLFVCLILYIYAFIRVSSGSNIKDVRRIALLMIVSSAAAFIVIFDGIFLQHCKQEF